MMAVPETPVQPPHVDPWRVIENPRTGEILTFLDRTPQQVTFDEVFPAGGAPVVKHSHPGTESFLVLDGELRLTVDDKVYDLGPGESYTVHRQLHFPSNVTDRPARVRVTCTGAPAFAERGLRASFGMARDGLIRPDGTPADILAMALLSENGAYYLPIMPRPLWVALTTVLGGIARLAGKRQLLDNYWPPDLPRPWSAVR
jgi:quercetin dioxygenase-like cupin family protein